MLNGAGAAADFEAEATIGILSTFDLLLFLSSYTSKDQKEKYF
jgi:hypothetical protein